jgi:hypothetical protein
MRKLILAVVLLGAAPAWADNDDEGAGACACDVTAAACDAGCACDAECAVDWSADECAQPGADCQPEAALPDEASLEAAELATPTEPETFAWTADAAGVQCADGATNLAGTCTVTDPTALEANISSGCAAGAGGGLVIGAALVGLLVIARRRRWLVALALASCTVGGESWDEAVDAGPTGDSTAYLDVYGAELGDAGAAQLLLANQPVATGAHEPVAEFSLQRASGGIPILRAGTRLVTAYQSGAELLGWARASEGDGTTALVELTAPDGTIVYETSPDAIADRLAAGYAQTDQLGFVWPPGYGDAPEPDDAGDGDAGLALAPHVAPAPCTVSRHSATHSALILLYASPGADESERFLLGCPGEVVIGEKNENGPIGRMKNAADQAAGGRTAFVLDKNGDKLRALLDRSNGLERTIAYLKHKLAIGYDYIVIDEITSASDWADGTSLNKKLRQLMQRMPTRTIIPYISIDLTSYAPGGVQMRDRRQLLRAFKLRARGLAMEVYLHTGSVIAGGAPAAFRRAADRLALAVSGLPQSGGINLRAITTVGTSMHSTYSQYRYLDEPSHDLSALVKEVNAIRGGEQRLRQQHGLGYYFVGKSDMAPPSAYTYDALIRRMRLEALRFK